MDLGGDTSRLYFYDPISYLKSSTLYSISPAGIGGNAVNYYPLPFISLLALLKLIFNSTVIISAFNGLKLSLSFLFVFLVIKDLINIRFSFSKSKSYIAAAIGGLFYAFAPSQILTWDKAILTHDQIFLNPLAFWLLLKFFTTNKNIYLTILLIISFIFSHNFSYVAAPPFFAFYPLSILFLLIYTKFIKGKNLPLKKIFIAGIIFLLLHSFHLILEIFNVFSSSGAGYSAVFSESSSLGRGLSYFLGVAPSVKVSLSIMALPQMTILSVISYLYIIFPLIIIFAFILKKDRSLLLTGTFFLVALFLATANITDSGFFIYKSLFYLPGFSMFRNYFGQWSYLYMFFYAVLLGQALYIILNAISRKHMQILASIVIALIVINSTDFIRTGYLNKIHYQSKNVSMLFEMDPLYEQVLKYFRNNTIDGKVISFPLTGPGYQMIKGLNGGAYQGLSTIAYLTGKNDFTGYAGLGQFGEIFIQAARNKDYESIEKLFSVLNIKYLFHNEDPYIYDTNFPQYPYDYVRDFMPKTQEEYKSFIAKLPVQQLKKIGDFYTIYSIDNDYYLPHIFTATSNIYTNNFLLPQFIVKKDSTPRTVTFDLKSYVNNQQLIFEAKNVSPIIELFNNYHLHVASPFISHKLNDVLYPFVVLREQFDLNRKKNNPDEYVDYNLLYLSKRILELNMFGDNVPVTRKLWNKPSLYNLFALGEYNSWEASFARYEQQMSQLIAWIPKSGKDESGQKVIQLKINESLDQHKLDLLRIIQNESKSLKDKKYLLQKTYSMFDLLYKRLLLSVYDPSTITYSFDMSNSFVGNYELFVRNVDSKLGDVQKMNVEIGGKRFNVTGTSNEGTVIQLEDVSLSRNEKIFKLHYQPENLVATTQWVSSATGKEIGDIATIDLGDTSSNNEGMVREIKGWRPNKQYVMTFEYNTFGKDAIFKFFDKRPIKDGEGYTQNVFFEKDLNSTGWKTQQSILTSDPESVAGFLQLISNSDDPSNDISIRNLSVYEVPTPSLIFQKKDYTKSFDNPPTITFKKINPTEYIVHVEKVNGPYILAFSEQFNNSWKLYQSDANKLKSESVIASYFNNTIREAAYANTFWDNSILTTFGKAPVADTTHYEVNGYANAWVIDPGSMKNKSEYDLIIEYTPQRNFYILLMISAVTLIGVIVWFTVELKQK